VEETTVTIVGAGPAGLAAAACLRRAGIDFLLLEKGQQIGSSWRRHYSRLHLHTVKRHSALPFLPFPEDYPRYVPRLQMIKYLEAYAAHFDLQPRLGQHVIAIDRDADSWCLKTAAAAAIRSRYLIIASGNNAAAVLPRLPGMEMYLGRSLHSIDYVDAKPFVGDRVLVIGMGNTGAEIALDLAEGGAHPTIAIRDGVHVVPRELFGIPIQVVSILATRLWPQHLGDRVLRPILDLALGNPARYGIKRPQRGIFQQIAQAGRIPVIDVGTLRSIAAGAIRLAPAVASIGERGAVFCDGGSTRYDTIVYATGYRPNYHEFLREHTPTGASTSSESGIYFIGFHNVATGLLREIGLEAVAVVADIAHRLGRRRSPGIARPP
jgi:cation diffusion facilitator CzcD-associated flavoprotein CzcO